MRNGEAALAGALTCLLVATGCLPEGRARAQSPGGDAGARAASHAARVELDVSPKARGREISRFVYGANRDWTGEAAPVTWVRLGGNRWSTYNWTNNASNAGSDWHHQNDGYLGGGTARGGAVETRLESIFALGKSALVTVPMLDRVAADKNKDGDVAGTPDYRARRLRPNLAVHGGDPEPGAVYEEDFVAWLEKTFPGRHGGDGPQLFYGLDNEPALWSSTHPRIHPQKARYDEVISRSVAYAKMVRRLAPKALLFGPASYGWKGMMDLQDAPDRDGRVFLAAYLDRMHAEGARAGRRLLDVLDVHWYPDVNVDGGRVGKPDASPAVVRKRAQITRSLWDPTYDEESWITRWGSHGPIRLIPRLRELVDAHAPGTKLAITEYDYGGGGDPSGAVAEADALGIFGREGVFAAAVLVPRSHPSAYIYGAFRMYLDYDGRGAAFGDVSVDARTSDVERVTVYASVRSKGGGPLTVVAINKDTKPTPVRLRVKGGGALSRARVFRLDRGPKPRADGTRDLSGGVIEDTLPPMSVTTYELSGGREGKRP